MTRTIKIIICLTMVILLLAGCAGQAARITRLEDLMGRTVGTLAGPMPVEALKKQIDDALGLKTKELLYFDSTAGAVSALLSNKIDAVCIPDFIADYYASRSGYLNVIWDGMDSEFSIHMALRAEDAELLDAVSSGIRNMKEDGTLDALKQAYVTELTIDDQLVGKDLPVIPDAPVIRVGISGDIPPLDYISADGRPAGYSLEVLTEIGRRANINFEVVSMANEAKFTALAANKIDLFFFHLLNSEVKVMTDTAAANSNIAFTEPYYTFKGSSYIVRSERP